MKNLHKNIFDDGYLNFFAGKTCFKEIFEFSPKGVELSVVAAATQLQMFQRCDLKVDGHIRLQKCTFVIFLTYLELTPCSSIDGAAIIVIFLVHGDTMVDNTNFHGRVHFSNLPPFCRVGEKLI